MKISAFILPWVDSLPLLEIPWPWSSEECKIYPPWEQMGLSPSWCFAPAPLLPLSSAGLSFPSFCKMFSIPCQMIFIILPICIYEQMMRRTNYLVSICLASLLDLTLSIVLMAFRVFSVRFLSYLSGLLRFLSNSKVESCNIWKQEIEKLINTQSFLIQSIVVLLLLSREIQWSLIKDQVNQSYLLVSYPFHATACRPWSISPYEDSSSSWSSCGIWIYRSEISAERSPIRN